MPKKIHTKKLFSGESAEDVHQRLAFPVGAACQGGNCRSRPTVGAITYAPYKEASEHYPEIAAMDANVVAHLLIRLRIDAERRGVPCVRLGKTYSCAFHRKDFERALAKLPSWILVEFQEGPKKSKFLSGAAGGSLV